MPIPHNKKYTADEFFKLIPENSSERYELYDGEIIALASPSEVHQDIALGIYTEARDFIQKNNGKCKPMSAPFDVVIDEKNVVQPDFFIVCDRNKMDGKRCNGVPDFIVEVTSSNYGRDYVDKLELYRRKGVREYWIVDPLYQRAVVYFFEKSDFPNIYTFDTPIPVSIYDGKLEIKISDLIV